MNNAVNSPTELAQISELSDEEVNAISGGAILLWAAGTAAVFGALSAGVSFGERIGRGLYYAMH